MLEPRAVAWGRVADIFVWAIIMIAGLGLFFAISSWAMRGFAVVRI